MFKLYCFKHHKKEEDCSNKIQQIICLILILCLNNKILKHNHFKLQIMLEAIVQFDLVDTSYMVKQTNTLS